VSHLPELLKCVASSADLTAVAAAFGAQPCWVEMPPAAGCRRLAIAGHAAEFTWLAAEATGAPPQAVRRLAGRLASEGRSAGVLGFYPDGRRLAIASGDRHLLVALDAPAPLHVACLSRLTEVPPDPWYADRVQAALSGSEAGAAFFRDFRAMVDRVAAAFPGPLPPSDRRALALVQLTRLLFLYFIECKGWLDGRPAFLREELDRCLAARRNIHRHFIEPLFFGTLNRPDSARSNAVRGFGRIPFLNGGLFEPHPLERRHRAALPNTVWREAADELFERYHFTVREGHDATAIAPDMLGQVFEGIMEPGDRRRSGTYFTPAALVRRLVDAGLAAALAARHGLHDAEALARLDAREQAFVRDALALRVLDPACGSGAFLLGALERLAALRMLSGASPGEARRRVLAGNIYGVDLDPMAVRLAELRLWLAVVAEERDSAPEQIQPLPNLDCLIRQGDSLMEPAELGLPPSPLARRLRVVRETLVRTTGPDKPAIVRELRQLEHDAAVTSLHLAEERVTMRIRELIGAARSPALFGTRVSLSADARRTLLALRREQHRLRASRRRVLHEGELPWFSFAGQFADVIADGGFDLVIGNPPWVRAEALPPAQRAGLSRRYRSWRAGGVSGFRHQPDLAVAFVERALELSASGGAVALLVPSKLATAGYGASLRSMLTTRSTLHAIVPLDAGTEARFAATVYPMAIVATRRTPLLDSRMVRSTLEPAPGGTPLGFYGDGPWVLRGGHAPAIVTALASSHPLFGQIYRCRLGVKTGADRIFVDVPDVEPDLLRPLLRGRDIRAYHAVAHQTLLWCYDADGVPLPDLPTRARRWLEGHEKALRARRDLDAGPLWQLFRTRDALDPHRLVWADLARSLVAAPLVGALRRAIPLNSCYVTSAPSRDELLAMTGWLNAPLIRIIARAGATEASGGFRRFNATAVSRIPFPVAARGSAALAELGAAGVAGAPAERDLDALAADMLGLDARDCAALRALA
jgi:hypothetical protein